jgi:hypothetical protein
MPAAGFNLADQEGRNKRLAKIGDRVTVTAEHAPDVRTGVITHIERRGVTVRHDYMAVNAHGFNWSWNEFDLDPGTRAPESSSPPDGPAGADHV